MFVIAQPFWLKDEIKHIDADTKQQIDSKEVSYVLTTIRNAKAHKVFGCISNICPGTYTMRIYIDKTSDSPKTYEYKSESLRIVQEIYRIK